MVLAVYTQTAAIGLIPYLKAPGKVTRNHRDESDS